MWKESLESWKKLNKGEKSNIFPTHVCRLPQSVECLERIISCRAHSIVIFRLKSYVNVHYYAHDWKRLPRAQNSWLSCVLWFVQLLFWRHLCGESFFLFFCYSDDEIFILYLLINILREKFQTEPGIETWSSSSLDQHATIMPLRS